MTTSAGQERILGSDDGEFLRIKKEQWHHIERPQMPCRKGEKTHTMARYCEISESQHQENLRPSTKEHKSGKEPFILGPQLLCTLR